MSNDAAFIAIRDHLHANASEITTIDTDYGPLSELLHTAMCEIAKSESSDLPCYLQHIGYFSYALVVTARTELEQYLLKSYCTNLLDHVIRFHLSESQISVEDAA